MYIDFGEPPYRLYFGITTTPGGLKFHEYNNGITLHDPGKRWERGRIEWSADCAATWTRATGVRGEANQAERNFILRDLYNQCPVGVFRIVWEGMAEGQRHVLYFNLIPHGGQALIWRVSDDPATLTV